LDSAFGSTECSVDPSSQPGYRIQMKAVEFTTELGEHSVVSIPSEIAAQLPKAGRARVIILTGDDPEDAEWRNGAYLQFARDDSPDDAVYDNYR